MGDALPQPSRLGKVCEVCRWPLDERVEWLTDLATGNRVELRTWNHTPSAIDRGCGDHDPVPVDGLEPEGCCDFCSCPLPRWQYDAVDFQLVDTRVDIVGDTESYGSVGAWAACDDCADDIDTNRIDRVTDRAAMRLASGRQAEAIEWLTPLHQTFMANKRSGREPVRP